MPNAGVPASVAVLLPLSMNVTPLGSVPVLLRVAVGLPDAVTVNVPAVVTVNVVLVALVIAGGAPVREKVADVTISLLLQVLAEQTSTVQVPVGLEAVVVRLSRKKVGVLAGTVLVVVCTAVLEGLYHTM